MKLHGKAAIITGGEGSIGMATARAFAAEGARVCLVGLVEDELRAGAGELGDAAIWALADVTSSVQVKSAVARAAETFGRLDVVVSNAGISGVIAPGYRNGSPRIAARTASTRSRSATALRT